MKVNPFILAFVILIAWPGVSAADDHPPFTGQIPREASRKGALGAAVRIAETSMYGRAFEAGLEQEDGAFVFEVSTRNEANVHELSISLAGDILEHEDEGLLGRLFGAAPDVLDIVEGSLIDAIAAVEAKIDGFAYSAELEFENGRPFYEIEALNADGSTLEAKVDGVSGAIISLGAQGD